MDITKKKILKSKMIDVETNQTEYNLETGKKKKKNQRTYGSMCVQEVFLSMLFRNHITTNLTFF